MAFARQCLQRGALAGFLVMVSARRFLRIGVGPALGAQGGRPRLARALAAVAAAVLTTLIFLPSTAGLACLCVLTLARCALPRLITHRFSCCRFAAFALAIPHI